MLRNIIFVTLIGLMIVFVLQNIQTVEIQFFIWKLTASRSLVLLLTFAAGLAGGWLLSIPLRKKQAGGKQPR
jgi:uncharacterized integral membrane protein